MAENRKEGKSSDQVGYPSAARLSASIRSAGRTALLANSVRHIGVADHDSVVVDVVGNTQHADRGLPQDRSAHAISPDGGPLVSTHARPLFPVPKRGGDTGHNSHPPGNLPRAAGHSAPAATCRSSKIAPSMRLLPKAIHLLCPSRAIQWTIEWGPQC